MNLNIRCVVSVLALAGLLSGPASAATGLARLPLKASVLAKPNVIFGVDDSGSMDSEVMLGTNDGAFWWDYNARTGFDAAGAPLFNAVGDANSQWRKMVYLFPNGSGTGNRVYSDADNDHFAIPPTADLAFVRSPDYNPIYYDPSVTYSPWSPAYVGGSLQSYTNASTTAAKSHPAYGSGTFNVRDAFAATTSTDWTFTALPGMRLPGSAKVCATTCTTWPAVSTLGWATSGSQYVVPASTKMRVSMDWFPATYYLKAACTADGTTCVTAPDGATLKRYEIKSGNTFPSGRTYAAELQNFANWWKYYRKRKLMLDAAMGQVLENLTGLRLGVVHFNARPGSGTRVSMYDTDAASASSNGRKVAGILYETDRAGGTPTRETLGRIGEEYMDSAGPVQYACQRNNAFILTDGFATVSSPSVPSYSKATYGSGAPYANTYEYSLADIALSYYTVNTRPGMAAGRVPLTDIDLNPNLHMNTYGLSLGAKGLLYNGDASVPPTTTGAWTAPTQNRHPSAVDDLWHATINGRGKMFLASTPTETSRQIQAGLTDILAQTGAQGGLAVSTVNLSRGDNRAYFGTYNPSGWAGDVTAHPINPASGEVDARDISRFWSAAAQLAARDWTTRQIISHDGSSSVGFTASAVGSLVNPGAAYGVTSQVIDHLRGDRSLEGSTFRTRNSLMGAVINSEPTVDRDGHVVYVQSGEGMLHAFDTSIGADGGKELWAFAPYEVLGRIGETTQRGYVFRTQLDGPITLATAGSVKLLVAGMGAAGKSYYALDVTTPRTISQTSLPTMWQFPAVGDATTQAKMGQTVGKARVVRHPTLGHVVLVTSGYNAAADGLGRMWMLNASTGAIIHEFVTPDGSAGAEAGLAQVSAYIEDNGSTRYVFGGDLLGNLWKFDLVSLTTTKVAVLKNGSGQAQPVTAAPELTQIAGQRVVIVGTGRLLDIGDFGGSQVQTMYAIADGATLSNARTALQQQTYSNDTTVTSNPVDWATQRGWYMDLPAGEKANSQPSIAYGAVAFVTNSNGSTDCSASSKLYVLDVKSGGFYGPAGFVSTTISDQANSSGVTALATASGKIIGSGQDADGNPWKRDLATAGTITPAKNAWREIRRR